MAGNNNTALTPSESPLVSTIQTVPEHSLAFMRAASGGTALQRDNALFLAGDTWLIGIGYPLRGPYDADSFLATLLALARERSIDACWAIAPSLPPLLQPHMDEEDVYYVLPADAPIASALRREVRLAEARLRIDMTTEFSAEHRRLWAEFLRRRPLRPQAKELFARTPALLHAPDTDIRLLNAWDREGHLAACFVMDYGPETFCSYIIGAHSRTHYTPHAADALMATMLRTARAEHKAYIHLGLGVNAGITRFKKKWGGVPTLPYMAASWHMHELPSPDHPDHVVRDALDFSVGVLLHGSPATGRRELPEQPEQRPYAMVWEVRKGDRRSFLGGTAHLFRYSFAKSFRKLFRQVDTVLFEGPLDSESLARVADEGSHGGSLAGILTEGEIRRLERVVRGPQGRLAHFCNMAWPHPADVRTILATHQPWSVFFTLYYAYLQRKGWDQSVDLEAWHIAHDMGCTVLCMESIDDQLASLQSIPKERILNFLRRPETWHCHRRQSLQAYLAGDIQKLQGMGTEFPSRTERVISVRDEVFLHAMLPHFERGGAVALTGSAHLFRLRPMLRERGFVLRQIYPTTRHWLLARLRGAA